MDHICIEEVVEAAAVQRSGLVVVAPEPDEIDCSHLGAMERINGFTSSDDFELFAREALSTSEFSAAPASRTEMLARLCRMPPKVYGQCHSMGPFSRAISSRPADVQHSSFEEQSVLHTGTASEDIISAKFCVQCAMSEHVTNGRSYWHREFQIPGIVKCPKHHTMLNDMGGMAPFSSAPITYETESRWRSLVAFEAFAELPVYRTYVGVCNALSETKRPYAGQPVSALLIHRCKTKYIRKLTSKDQRKAHYQTISDLAFEQLPLKWIRMLGEWIALGETIVELENAVWGTGRTRTEFYALACALLFSSADEVLDYVVGVDNCFRQSRNRSPRERRELMQRWIMWKERYQIGDRKQGEALRYRVAMDEN
jgi:hypothetical protein